MGGAVKAVSNGAGAIGGVIGGIPGALIGGIGGNIVAGQTPPDPRSLVNSTDPRLSAMRDRQVAAAQDYGANINKYENQQQNTATDVSRQNLSQQLAGASANSNSRGLLYGGYNEGQQANATAQNQASLQQQKSDINTNAQNTLSGLEGQALGTGLMINQTQQNQNQLAYQAALQQQMQNNQLFGSLLGGAGGIAGRMAAG